MYEISVMVGLAVGGLVIFLLAVALARRTRARSLARRVAGPEAAGAAAEIGAAADPMGRRLELRLDEIEARLEAGIEAGAGSGAEERLRAMADSLVGLIRDKNATLETALAGLDQLRARLRALEQMGDLAEARGLFERLETRIDELRAAQASQSAAFEERVAGLAARAEAEAAPGAALAEQFSRLYARKDEGIAAMLARLAPFEARLAEIETARAAEGPARETLARLEARVEALRGAQETGEIELAALRTEIRTELGAGPVATIAERLGGLHAQKEALVETLLARIGALEEAQIARDPKAALDRFAERLEAIQSARLEAEAALRERIGALETPGESPFAEISAQLTRLYAQKDASVEAVFARLAPLEARLSEIETGLAAQDPRAALDRFAERLEAAQGRIAALEAPGENPFAEISEQLTRLYAQKDTAVETVLARLAPLEARLAEVETGLAAQDPRAALDRFAERLEAAQVARAEAEGALRDRIDALEAPAENPFAEISEQLTRLYAQKDATVEVVFARLAPLEARLSEVETGLAAQDPRAALDRFAERLEAAQARITELEAPDRSPFAEISEQLTRLYAQKDADIEAVRGRLAPLEARLGDLEADIAARDPRSVLDAFAARLDAAQALRAAAEAALRDRIAALEAPGENPFAEISEQLTRLYAQKDATVETVFARLAPLETRLEELAAGLAGQDPKAALDRFAERLEAAQARITELENPGESPFADISDQLARLYAQKDAAVETVFARLAPLEARLGRLEEEGVARDPKAALDRFAERLEAAQAARLEAEAALRDRLLALENPGENPFAEISAQLTRLYAQKDATVETVFARLAPLETRLDELAAGIVAQDPRAALDRFAERLEAAQARINALENPGENPFEEISERLARLQAEKDAGVETVLARLAPLEARLSEIETGIETGFAPRVAALETREDPRAALAELGARIEALREEGGAAAARIETLREALGEAVAARPFAEIADQLTRLYAQKDAHVAAVAARLIPLEARLAELEARPTTDAAEEEAARAEAQAIATQMIAARAAAEQTELFANRLALLEASLPRISAAQTRLSQVLERQAAALAETVSAPLPEARTPAVAPAATAAIAPPAEAGADPDDLAALQELPRVVSLHLK